MSTGSDVAYCLDLNWPSLGCLLWLALVRGVRRVRVFADVAPRSLKARLLSRAGCRVESVRADLKAVRGADGKLLWADVIKDQLGVAENTADRIMADGFSLGPLYRRFGKDPFRGFLIQRLGKQLELDITLVYYCEAVSSGESSDAPLLLVDSGPWRSAMRDLARAHGVALFFVPFRQLQADIRQILFSMVKLVKVYLADRGNTDREPAKRPEPSVLCFQDYPNVDPDPAYRHAPYWYHASRKRPFPVHMIKRQEVEYSEEELSNLASLGVHFHRLTSDASPGSANVPPVPSRMSFSIRAGHYRAVFPGAVFGGLYRLARCCEAVDGASYWGGVVEELNVKVFLYSIGSEPGSAVEMALAWGGGAGAMWMYSNIQMENWVFSGAPGIIAGFSRKFETLLVPRVSRAGYFLETGYPFDKAFPLVRDAGNRLREEMRRAGADYVIAYFDENWLESQFSWVKRADAVNAARFFAEWVLEDESVGVAYKIQYVRNDPGNWREIADTVARAEATGRFRVLTRGGYHSAVFPAEAARASDLTVGQLFGATATLEAALSGTRSVHLDCMGYGEPLFSGMEHDLVFSSLEALKRAVEGFRGGDEAWADLGDWTPILDRYDPMRDGRAAERLGDVLEFMVAELSKPGGKQEALDRAAKAYAAKWATRGER